MATTIITTEDLHEFKLELLDEFKELLDNQSGLRVKKWLRSSEVIKYLKLSPASLQNFRDNGTIPFTRIGTVLYYDYQEIIKLLEKNKIHNKF